MSHLKSKVGTRSEKHLEKVTAEHLASFARAIGMRQDGPLKEAPATFLTVFRKGEFELLQLLDLKLSNALHAEQEYEYEGQIFAGDQVEFQTTLTQVLEKQSATHKMQFVILETEFLGGLEKRRVGKAKSTLVFREKV